MISKILTVIAFVCVIGWCLVAIYKKIKKIRL